MTRSRAKAKAGSEASSTTLGGKRKGVDLEVTLPPRKRLREATGMSQEEFWGSVVRLLESMESQMEESSRVAAEREERLRGTMAMVAANLLSQNRLLKTIEEVLKTRGRSESSDEDEEDEGSDGGDEGQEVQILDRTAEESEGSGEVEIVEQGGEDVAKGGAEMEG